MKKNNAEIGIPIRSIENKILLIRGLKVMLDRDLAELYGVSVKHLKRQVNRNKERFPVDFMFKLATKEFDILRCHFGTSSWGGLRYMPYAFTEHGILMLSSVLNSKRAILVNIQIMRAFIRLREILATHKDLQRKIEQHDRQISSIFKTLRRMLNPPSYQELEKRKIGFLP
ncbi:MAG: ORF6N domain-containing protein [Elusimicrobiota bacterium]